MYYLSQPVENVPYDFYLEFLPQSAGSVLEDLAALGETLERRDGKYSQFTALAIPLCLGDYLGPFRVVGTTTDFFDDLTFGPESNKKYTFARAATSSRSPRTRLLRGGAGGQGGWRTAIRVGDNLPRRTATRRVRATASGSPSWAFSTVRARRMTGPPSSTWKVST